MTQKKIKLKTINNESIVGTGNFDLSDFVTDDDSRLTDARTPLSHTHGNITSDGKIGSNSGYIIVTSTNGAISTTQTIGAAKVKDSKEHVNIGTLGDATQGTINTAIDTALGNKEDKANKVNAISSSSTTTQYPSAKAVYDTISDLSHKSYVLSSSNYNPSIDSTVTISCTVTDMNGSGVSGESVVLYNNGTSVGSATTNSSGVASWSVTLSDWDLHHFSCNGATLELKANGWKVVHSGDTNPYYLAYNDKFVKAYINYSTTVNWSTTVGHLGAEWLKDGNIDLRPPMPITVTPSPNKNIILSNNDYRVGWFTNSGTSTGGLYAHFLYARK